MSSDSKEVYVDPKDVQQVIELGDDKDNKDLDAGLENLDIKDDQSEINENNLFTDNENDGMYSEKDEKDETPDDSVEQFLQHTGKRVTNEYKRALVHPYI